MAMETLCSTDELLDFMSIYDTPYLYNPTSTTSNYQQDNSQSHEEMIKAADHGDGDAANMDSDELPKEECSRLSKVEGVKKRSRRRGKVCKNKEEGEAQRITHITVERNRRKQMNDHLSLLRSLMPHSYLQRGDQASIVGGAIDFIKELEHIVQTLEAQKFVHLQQTPTDQSTPFAQFFALPQFTLSQTPSKQNYTCCKMNGAIADIEVSLIETHANITILSRQRLPQLSHLISGFQALYLTILHFNVTTLEPMVLYSISSKLEERCLFKSSDDIAGAIHQMLRIIEGEEGATGFP